MVSEPNQMKKLNLVDEFMYYDQLKQVIGEKKFLSFEDYNTACGANGDKISNIIVDRFHHVWITTSREVKEFNPKNGAYIQ